ncbi:hypothetical protein [Actinomadura rupiterrae]|uniref:hypothetical protein n=1 Tax=Actinomadura rupiterrae TaxID=559627 RepID=UPI0020A53035|nr:hypothetical protein [Actinomadura rupiterrae]MCP2337771.1 hypothetical protein [Actinomadura rupiterrae]
MSQHSRTDNRPRRVVLIGALVGTVLAAGVLPPPPNPVQKIAQHAVARHAQR